MAGCCFRDFDRYCEECVECDGYEYCAQDAAYEEYVDEQIDLARCDD